MRISPRIRRGLQIIATALALVIAAACSSTGPRAAAGTSRPDSVVDPFTAWERATRARADDLLESAQQAASSGQAGEALSCSDEALTLIFSPPGGYPLNSRYLEYAAQLLDESAALDDQLAPQQEYEAPDSPLDDLSNIVLEHLPDYIPDEPVARGEGLPQSDLPLVLNGPVEHFLEMFTNPNEYRSRISKGLQRGGPYLSMIRASFRSAGLPEDLAYLPLIESAYSTRARSRARAYGMWQFIAPTARLYGLQISPLLDERCDPERATQAAVAHLADLHAQFGDWYLALAAYNSGAGNVRRAIRRARSHNFWKIRRFLPRETRNYVPAFIASVIVAKDPTKFNFEPMREDPLEFDAIEVPDAVDLQFLSTKLDIPLDELRNLNPAVRRDLTPARRKTRVRLPKGTRQEAEALLASVPRSKWAPRLIHTVRKGDSLYAIARRYGSTVASIRRANGLHRNLIRPGQSLVVPRLGLVRRRSVRHLRKTSAGARTYIVRPNDTLWDIARSFGVSVKRLRVANGLGRHSVIRPSDRLRIPAVSPKAHRARRRMPAFHRSYTVRRGDTLFEIALRFGTSVRALRRANGLRGSRIHPGDVLRIPHTQARG